jgi:ABC-type multidrug transport system fused ATPase/permease subunit
VTRTLKLWAEIFALSWRRARSLTVATLAALLGGVLSIGGSALALRVAVDSASEHAVLTAVIGAACAAVAYSVLIVVRDVTDALILTIADRVGRMDIHAQVYRDLATLEGLDHLERSEYLNRITLVRKSGGRLAAGMWNGLRSIASLLNLVVMLLLLGSVSPWLIFLVGFAGVPIWLDHRGEQAIQNADLATAEPYRLQQHLFALCVSSVSGKELRVAGAAAEIMKRQSAAWNCAMHDRLRAQSKASALTALGWTIFVLAFVAGLALAAYRASQGREAPGDIVLLVTIAVMLRASVQSTVESTIVAASSRQYIAPFFWLRDYAAEFRNSQKGSTEPPSALSEGITLDQVSYRYPGSEQFAVDGVSIRLPAGTVVAIVGEYGSGKTTLVKLLCKFYRLDHGRILVDSTDIADIRADSWWRQCSAAFQDFGRFHTTLAENVGLGDLKELNNEERIRAALADAEADELVERLPNGLQTLLGRHLGGVELSEGQWQRSALARASMRKSPLLFVLDEPTASLDAPSEQAIFERYMQRARAYAASTGAVTVIVSHRFSTVTGADLILVLDHGRLVESGTHSELLAMGGIYAGLYGIQANAYRIAGKSHGAT